MINKKILHELHSLLQQRGEISRVQKEYAKTELRAMKEIFAIVQPEEEVRLPNRRTLEKYLGDRIFGEITEEREPAALVSVQ